MEDWTTKADDQVFTQASEQPGSQASYWRETEIKRRLYLLEKENLHLQARLLRAQQDSVAEQRASTAQMAEQSRLMLFSVIGVFLTALVTLAVAFIR